MSTPRTVYRSYVSELVCGDVFEVLSKMEAGSVDVIFADPPYFLSDGGISCKNGKMVSGTIWITGTFHNIYSIGVALEQEGYEIINNITWQKPNPPPNLACKCFTHSTETVIWAKKKSAKPYFNYQLMKELNGGKQMKDVWVGTAPKASEKKYGKHETQKPEWLLERIVLASTKPNECVLDPFMGSGTTGVSAIKNGRRFIGIEKEERYFDISLPRIKETESFI